MSDLFKRDETPGEPWVDPIAGITHPVLRFFARGFASLLDDRPRPLLKQPFLYFMICGFAFQTYMFTLVANNPRRMAMDEAPAAATPPAAQTTSAAAPVTKEPVKTPPVAAHL